MTWKWPFFSFSVLFCFFILFFIFCCYFCQTNQMKRGETTNLLKKKKTKKHTEEKKLQMIRSLRKTKNQNVGQMKRGSSVLSSPGLSHLYGILLTFDGCFYCAPADHPIIFILFYFPSYFPNNVLRKTKNPRDGHILLDTMKSRKWYFLHRRTC